MSIITGVGSPGTVSAASGGYSLAFNNLTTTPQVVLPQVPGRKQVTFHNPGTVDVFVAMEFVQNTGQDVALNPTTSALGGCFRVYANGGTLIVNGECQKPWVAFAASGSGNPLTVWPSNV
jgi:hypothetical protein